MENKEKNYSVHTRNLIALCHIINEFSEFEERLLKYISPKYNRDFVAQLYDITCEGKFKLGARKAKRFYSENKEIIDTINKYTNISMFINMNYGFHGDPHEDFQYFYKYISSHKSEIDKILPVLEKIKSLGFDKLEFNENLDFTKEITYVYPSFRRNFIDMKYFDNAEVIPTYENDVIEYKSTDSNYLMTLSIIGDDFSDYGRKITINSLTFDPSRLPNEISKQNIFDTLVAKAGATQEKRSYIRSSVNLGVSVLDLDRQLSSTSRTITGLEDVKNKTELIEVLTRMKADLEQLKVLSAEHDASISEKEPVLSSDVLENEKKLYLHRRDMASIHWD